MEDCACVDIENRCDNHKEIILGPNILTGNYDPLSKIEMEDFNELFTESAQIKETDAMGREIFWEDIGRKDD